MIMLPEGFDSNYRYIIVVSQRAEQLIGGAKPRAESRHAKPTLIAKQEVDSGLVQWRILTPEELEEQRQAMVEQFRAEVGGEGEEEGARPVPDVLPTAPAADEKTEPAEEPEDRDEEVARLQRLLGMAAEPADDDPLDAAEELPAENEAEADDAEE